jgi:hypothetical protein
LVSGGLGLFETIDVKLRSHEKILRTAALAMDAGGQRKGDSKKGAE